MTQLTFDVKLDVSYCMPPGLEVLDSTLVLVTSDFGRTPKINAGGGRNHWPRVFSIVMAGNGVNADADS